MPDPDVRANTPSTVVPAQYSGAPLNYFAQHELAVGEEIIPRVLGSATSQAMTSGGMRTTHFTARKTETITQIRVGVGSPAAGATPTLIRFGIYSVAADGSLTALLASTPNDTTLLASTFNTATKALSAPFSKVAGERYAVGFLVVSAAAMPALAASGGSLAGTEGALAPRIAGHYTSLADLPATASAAQLGNAVAQIYAALLP